MDDLDDLYEMVANGELTRGEFEDRIEHLRSKARPVDPARPRASTPSDNALVEAARDELAGPSRITYEEAKRLGGPDNPRVRELIARGRVEGVPAPVSR